MADRTTIHQWVNSTVAVMALVVSGVSALFTWQGNQAKKEALAMTVKPTGACRTEYHQGEGAGQIGLCWAVTLANGSENRLSIVDYKLVGIEDAGMVQLGPFQNFEAMDGTPLGLPLTLDGGEAKEIIVRAGIKLPPYIVHAIAQMPEYQNHNLDKMSIDAVQRSLALAKMDIVGNAVDPMLVDGKLLGFSIQSPFKRAVNLLVLTTGRGTNFHATLTYPPEPER